VPGTKTHKKPWGKLYETEDGEMIPVVKHRRLYVEDEEFSLQPDTLVGSAFLVVYEDQPLWKGVVVGEPQAGRYLVEMENLEEGVENVQRLFSLDTLMGLDGEGKRLVEGAIGELAASVTSPKLEWRLYDSAEEAAKAYIAWSNVRQRQELEAALREPVSGEGR
jgi:hypothetical protein